MSLTSSLSHSYDRNSFSDRFCDDLSEVILEWLPIEDKISFTAVSQQFRRCLQKVWKRQRILKVMFGLNNNRNDFNDLIQLNVFSRDPSVKTPYFAVDVKRLERVLQIFENINEILFSDKDIPIDNRTDVLNAIIKNANHLQSIAFDFQYSGKQFEQKFGKQLKQIDSFGYISRSLLWLQSSECLSNILVDNNKVLAKGLKKLRVNVIEYKGLFELLVKNCPELTYLEITLTSTSSTYIRDLLLPLSELKGLKFLSITTMNISSNDKSLNEGIEAIAMNCKELKYFGFRVKNRMAFNTRLFFESLTHFSSLKRLCFESTLEDIGSGIPVMLTNKLDINCKHLTHLELISDQITEDYIHGIESVVPLLKCLVLRIKTELTDNILVSIARLERLESLSLESCSQTNRYDSITDSGLLTLVFNCKHLHTIQVHNKTAITEITINALAQKATKNSGIYYKYYFKGIEDSMDLEVIIQTISDPLNNILITGKHQIFCNDMNFNKQFNE